ncbi:neuralized-like protein 4 isoform X2 [Oratosquilla oratoria]|uniref:neuralized-like protein 4 isoform X2 n=1 Tax=Oratosquilla oratoria TaxID=337810 RepID=UPI003F76E135
MSAMFHPRCGRCVVLSNGNKTACRTNPTQEFNRGLIFSLEPIKDNEIFEVKIDKKLNTWSGSIEIGVTVCNPDVIDIPITATDLRGGTWIMLGQGVLRDGRSLHEAYGCDLDKLVEGDRVGVMRTSQGELKFFVNGDCQGVAACNLPSILYAVVDMYGKCAQITVTAPTTPDSNTLDEDSISEMSSLRDSNLLECQQEVSSSHTASSNPQASSCSALSNHVANISIANSIMSNSDSNLRQDMVNSLCNNSSSNITTDDLAAPTPLDSNQLRSTLPSDQEACVQGGEGASLGGGPCNVGVGGSGGASGQGGGGGGGGGGTGTGGISTPASRTLASGSTTGTGGNSTANSAAGGVGNCSGLASGTSTGRGNAGGEGNSLTVVENSGNGSTSSDNMANYHMSDRLRFHNKCGTLVKLSNSGRTAERRRPLDEFNNGVVMSHRALRENELFEIRIDRLVDKWSGSIEVGITTHNPSLLDFPATMTNMRSGTTMMSGTGILTNGKGTHREYGEFNLDELKEGDRIGMMIKAGRQLHYYINGLDQGVAAAGVPAPVWSVVDLYGMTVKVTIVDRDEREEQNLITRRNTQMRGDRITIRADTGVNVRPLPSASISDEEGQDLLLFHASCGTYAKVINNGRTAHRPNAMEDFNNGVVLTRRPLKPNEMFEVRLDRCVDKWAGSLEIGVTTHSPTDLEYPSTMTNVRSGTWMMTGNGVMHNGTTVIDDYGLNLDRLKVGDRVGVVRKENGTVNFYVNSVDQGIAATNVPEHVYGVVDLYGQAAQATIVQHNAEHRGPTEALQSSVSSSTMYCDLRFHHIHGRNARIINGGITAQRPNAQGEFNDAIVMTARPLHEGEMFEVIIEKMVDRWSGSLEAGVTAIPPEEIDFPSTMTDIDYDTWMLSGSSVMRDGVTIMNNYKCDLDSLTVGTCIGMMRHSDGGLHIYINGEDQGVTCENLPSTLWGVIDLYGQCAQVSIVHNPIRPDQSLMSVSQYLDMSHLSLPAGTLASVGCEVLHKFSPCCGPNIQLSNNNTTATRIRHYNNGLIFTSRSLEAEEMFEVRLDKICGQYSGAMGIGLTTLGINDAYPVGSLPSTLGGLDKDSWWVTGSDCKRNNGTVLRLNFCPNLNRLVMGDRVGIKKCTDGTMRLFINGEDFGIAASNITKRVFGVLELFGSSEAVTITSVSKCASTPVLDAQTNCSSGNVLVSQDSLELFHTEPPSSSGHFGARVAGSMSDSANGLRNEQATPRPPQGAEGRPSGSAGRSSGEHRQHQSNQNQSHNKKAATAVQFHENHGKNIHLALDRTVAKRSESYNQGIVMSARPLTRNVLFQVRLGALNPRWSSSLMVGVTAQSPEKLSLPNTALSLKKNTWIICGDSVFYNGVKIKGRYGPDLDSLAGGIGGHQVGVLVDNELRLHLYVNGVDQGVAAKEIPANPYVILDLYGQCEEVIISSNEDSEVMSSTAGTNQNKKNILKGQQIMSQQHSNTHTNITGSTNINSGTNINENSNNSSVDNINTSTNMNASTNMSSGTNNTSINLSAGTNMSNEANELRHPSSRPSAHIQVQHSPHIQSPPTSKDKEKGFSRALPDSSVVKNCEYQNMCMRFKNSLALPEGYFNQDGNVCYCETCHKIRGDELYYTKGNPPKQYTQPFGWCRFALVSGVGENNESWHMAYHGTRPGAIRRMLDKGELLFTGELGVSSTLAGRRSKDDDSDGSQLCFSPTITYASDKLIAPPVSFVDPMTQRCVKVHVVLQVAVEPGSYKVGPPSIPWSTPLGPQLNTDTIEWVTKERGSTQLMALLIKIEASESK